MSGRRKSGRKRVLKDELGDDSDDFDPGSYHKKMKTSSYMAATRDETSGEEEDDDSSNDRPAGMKIARMGSDGVGRAAVRSPDPSPVRRSNRARKVRQVVKEDSEEGDEEDGDQREGGEEEIDDQVGRTIEELKGEEELKKKLPGLVVRVPRLAPHKVQAATAVGTNIKVDPEQQPQERLRLDNELEDEVGGSDGVRHQPPAKAIASTAATPIDSRSEMVPIQRPATIKVDPEPEQENEDFNVGEDPLQGTEEEPAEEGEEGSPQPSGSKQWSPSNRGPNNSYILSECVEYIVDEVKLLVRVAEKYQSPRVYLMCPVCGSVETVKNLGNHLYTSHSAGYLRCPGKRCLGFRVHHNELCDHIHHKHFKVTCKKCGDHLDARLIRQHTKNCGIKTRTGELVRHPQRPAVEPPTSLRAIAPRPPIIGEKTPPPPKPPNQQAAVAPPQQITVRPVGNPTGPPVLVRGPGPGQQNLVLRPIAASSVTPASGATPRAATLIPRPPVPGAVGGIRTIIANPGQIGGASTGQNQPVVISHTYTGQPPRPVQPGGGGGQQHPRPNVPLILTQRTNAAGQKVLTQVPVTSTGAGAVPAQVRADQARQNVIILPKQQPAAQTRPNNTVVPFALPQSALVKVQKGSKNYEVMMKGKLVRIDGVFFYVKSDEVIFTDCPICEDKSMACSVVGSHLITDHMQFSVTCHADGCNAKVQSNVLQEHLLSNHGKVECRGCGFVLGILNARDHFDDEGECLKNKKKPPRRLPEEVGPIVAAHPTSGGRLNSYDVDTSRPLLEKSGNNSVSHNGLPSLDERSLGTVANPDLIDVSPPQSMKDSDLVGIGGQDWRGSTWSASDIRAGKVPTLPCPYCNKQCSYLKKHIRDVHQPKTSCPICGRRMGHSYLPEHMKIQHQGKQVPTKRCPICLTAIQKLKNHLKLTHKMSKSEADELYERYYPMSEKAKEISRTRTEIAAQERDRQYAKLTLEGLPDPKDSLEGPPDPETSITVEDRVLLFDD